MNNKHLYILNETPVQIIDCDYIFSMTDNFALRFYGMMTLPNYNPKKVRKSQEKSV